jgi:hypothetical protein
MAAQRAAEDADFATLKEQLRPPAFRPALSAAKAALVALMQNTSKAAATISMVNRMARSFSKVISLKLSGQNLPAQSYLAQTYCEAGLFGFHSITEASRRRYQRIGPVLA